MSYRIERINQLIKKELSQILLKELDFPKRILITITRVETSIDLSQVRIYISVIPPASQVIQILNNKIYLFQSQLNKRLKMRVTPKIIFLEEKKTGEAARIEKLLEEIKKRK